LFTHAVNPTLPAQSPAAQHDLLLPLAVRVVPGSQVVPQQRCAPPQAVSEVVHVALTHLWRAESQIVLLAAA
jgi:hypothetical protein